MSGNKTGVTHVTDYRLNDIDGNMMYCGPAKNKRAFLAELIKSGKSFARADFSKQNLSGLEMHRINAPGAKFDGADMRGSQMLQAFCPGASFVGALMPGANIEMGHFEACNFNGADMSSVKAKLSSFRGSRFNAQSNFSDSLLSSSDFSYVVAHGTSFENADMSNADMSHSEFKRCDFSGTVFGPRMMKKIVPGALTPENLARLQQHLPNRTRGAKVTACKYTKETSLHHVVPALKLDRRICRAAKFLLWTATTAAVVFGGETAIDALKETGVADGLGSNAGLIGVLGLAYFTKDVIGEFARDFMEDKLIGAVHMVESAAMELNLARARHSGLVALVGRKLSLQPLHLALSAKIPEARSKGLTGAFRAFTTDIGHIIVCDRAHLAMALSALSSNRGTTFPIPHDIVLMRSDCDHPDGLTAPCAVSFLKDGRTSAVWPCGEGRHATTVYDTSGALTGCYDGDGRPTTPEELSLPRAALNRLDANLEFEATVLAAHGLKEFSYDRETHFIQAGADGSILVQNHSDRRVDNRHGNSPAVVRPDGTGIIVRGGSIIEEWVAPRRGTVPAGEDCCIPGGHAMAPGR